MKFFAPILFAGAALASTQFTVWVNDEQYVGRGNATTIPQPYSQPSRVGFTFGEDTGDAVLSLDDSDHLDGFVLRQDSDGVFALLVDQATEDTGDITGPFTIDDNTREFKNLFAPDLTWWICSPQGTPDEEVYIYLTTGGSVPADSCWTAHELIAWPL
ncbi:hypothetical protein B0J18DRAFT_439831 [Chaetomium sp. MPI-SDFR-AT-0129]|nr:hypothetical protein B0J18DRAFT_439831 [Chaetomium sp. MPI-SDFR-AT-0129]